MSKPACLGQIHRAFVREEAKDFAEVFCSICRMFDECHKIAMSLPPKDRQGTWAGIWYSDSPKGRIGIKLIVRTK